MSTAISALPTANTIDASADYLPIVTASLNATQKINRNTLLNLSSTPLGLTDTQSPTNKTFDNTNTITIKDANLTLQNSSATTKQAKFSLSGITAGQTRTITLPDYNATMASLAGTETLTNKTLTSPTINSPTITNATISADAITGYSSSSTGTIYGIAVTSGVITGSATVNNAALSNTGTFGSAWAWQSFTPSPTGYSGTPTVNSAKYTQIGKIVVVRISFTGTSNATTCTFTLPVSATDTPTFHSTVTDSGTVQTSSGLISCSGTTATCYKTLASGAFTNTGTKAVSCFGMVYEAS